MLRTKIIAIGKNKKRSMQIKKVLLIDDDASAVVITTANEGRNTERPGWLSSLLPEDHKIKTHIKHYSQGVKELQQRAAEYDLVLVDHTFKGRKGQPARFGTELLKEANAKDLGVPILFLTATGDEKTDQKAQEAGATYYLDKSELTDILLERSIRYASSFQKTINELNQALAQEKVLTGLLNTCPECRTILGEKNGQPYRYSYDHYFKVFSGTQWTHTVCRECFIEKNPDYADLYPEETATVNEEKTPPLSKSTLTKKRTEPEKRILLIDDIHTSKELLADLLTDEYKVTKHIKTYEQGVIEINERTAEYDIIVLDHTFPGRREKPARFGTKLLQEVNAKKLGIPIIFTTATGNKKVDLSALKHGAMDYLEKEQLSKTLLERSLRYATKHQDIINELKQTLVNVAHLKSLIPICAGCMKVRVGNKYVEFEEYIRQYAKVQFEKNTCPACSAKKYLKTIKDMLRVLPEEPESVIPLLLRLSISLKKIFTEPGLEEYCRMASDMYVSLLILKDPDRYKRKTRGQDLGFYNKENELVLTINEYKKFPVDHKDINSLLISFFEYKTKKFNALDINRLLKHK